MGEKTEMKSDTERFLSFFEGLGKAIASISGALVIFSAFYDYNYLLALGLTFNDVPTTIPDHVRSAIVWLPRLAVDSFSACIILTFFRLLVVGSRTRTNLRARPKPKVEASLDDSEAGVQQQRISVARTILKFIVFIFIALIVLSLPLFNPSYLYIAFLVIWTPVIIVLVYGNEAAFFSVDGLGLWLLVLSPLYLAYVGARGYREGDELRNKGGHTRQLSVSELGGKDARICNVIGIRRFGSSVVLISREGVAVIPADRLLEVRTEAVVVPEEGRSCP